MKTKIDGNSLVVRADGVYEMTLRWASEEFSNLIRDNYGRDHNLSHEVTKAFAERFVKENYADLARLIDMETVKLLATRRLAGLVAKEGGDR